jgi:hypothetical protein
VEGRIESSNLEGIGWDEGWMENGMLINKSDERRYD